MNWNRGPRLSSWKRSGGSSSAAAEESRRPLHVSQNPSQISRGSIRRTEERNNVFVRRAVGPPRDPSSTPHSCGGTSSRVPPWRRRQRCMSRIAPPMMTTFGDPRRMRRNGNNVGKRYLGRIKTTLITMMIAKKRRRTTMVGRRCWRMFFRLAVVDGRERNVIDAYVTPVRCTMRPSLRHRRPSKDGSERSSAPSPTSSSRNVVKRYHPQTPPPHILTSKTTYRSSLTPFRTVGIGSAPRQRQTHKDDDNGDHHPKMMKSWRISRPSAS